MMTKPFLVIVVPREHMGSKIYKDMGVSKDDWTPQAAGQGFELPEVANFFLSDYAKEFHRYIGEAGFGVNYEFSLDKWGKVFKRVKLIEDGKDVKECIGFNDNIRHLTDEMLGKFGTQVLHKRMKLKELAKQHNIENDMTNEVNYGM
jgi:hypothetical protein